MKIDAELDADHALGIAHVLGPVEPEGGRKRVQDRSSALSVRGRRSLEDPLNVLVGDGLAAQRGAGAEARGGQAAARHIDDDPANLHARHAFGRINGEAGGVLGRVQIDHRAALDAVRALMADAEHFASMRASAQGLRRLHRRQAGDQANDLRGADVEHRKNGAFARRDLPHARRERMEAHSWAPFFAACASAQAAAASCERRTNARPGTRKSTARMSRSRYARLAFQAQKRRDRGFRIGFRQLDVDARFQSEIPAPLADQDASFDAGLQFVHRFQESDELPRPPVRAFSDDKGQIGIAAVGDFVDRRAVGRDRAHVAILLPDAVGGPLDDVDHDLVRVELAHARLFHERIGLEPRSRLGDVEERKRARRSDAGDRQDSGLAHVRRAGDGDNFDAEA